MMDAADTVWSVLLGHMVVAKQAIAEAEPGRLEPFAPPRPKATEAEIVAFETQTGQRLPTSYREFLSHADGWPYFYFDMDLFGLAELSGGGQHRLAGELLTIYSDDEVLDEIGLDREALLPVAAGRGMRHLVAIVRTGLPDAGQVTWLDGEQVGRYPDFRAYFTAMTRFLMGQAQRLRDSRS